MPIFKGYTISPEDERWLWIWVTFNSVGMGLSLWKPETFLIPYTILLAILEAIGLGIGRPFTRYIWGLIDWGRQKGKLQLAIVSILTLLWSVGLVTLFREYGWFPSETLNTTLAVAFFIWILPHFFGRTW